jgi:hypothetical protein
MLSPRGTVSTVASYRESGRCRHTRICSAGVDDGYCHLTVFYRAAPIITPLWLEDPIFVTVARTGPSINTRLSTRVPQSYHSRYAAATAEAAATSKLSGRSILRFPVESCVPQWLRVLLNALLGPCAWLSLLWACRAQRIYKRSSRLFSESLMMRSTIPCPMMSAR